MDEYSRHDIDPTCKCNAIESVKNEDDVKPKRIKFMREIIIMRLKFMKRSQQIVIHYCHYWSYSTAWHKQETSSDLLIRMSQPDFGRKCTGLEGFRKILILSSWMADERISWRRKLPAVISFVSFREGMIRNFSIDGLAFSFFGIPTRCNDHWRR